MVVEGISKQKTNFYRHIFVRLDKKAYFCKLKE